MLEYQIALCNVWWDNRTIDTRYFNSIEDQTNYFDELTGGVYSPLVNFNINNNIETSCFFKNTNNLDIETLLKCNYAVVRRVKDNEEISRRYYFITNIQQDSFNQVHLQISLDDIQTNYFKYKNDITPCLIKRGFVDRFLTIPELPDEVTFNNKISSKLFDLELPDFSKYTKNRKQLKIGYSQNENVNDWLYNNLLGWCYVFVSSTHPFKFYNDNGTSEITKNITLNYMSNNNIKFTSDIGCVCYPLLKPGAELIYNGISINQTGLTNFKNNNNNTSFFFSYKLSLVSPFNYSNTKFDITNNNLIITTPSNFEVYRTSVSGSANTGLIININQDDKPLGVRSPNFINTYFLKSDIINKPHDKKFNPKLLNYTCKRLRISTNNGDYFDYDIQKLGDNFSLWYSEPIQPEITKGYLRLMSNPVLDNLYKNTSYNYYGLVTNVDNSIMYTNDAYQSFISNNKNFYQQTNWNVISSTLPQVIRGASSLNIVSVINAGISAINQYQQAKYQVDNLQNAPDIIQRASGNVLFNLMVQPLGIYAEELEANEKDLITMDNYTNCSGYTLNIVDNITNYDNTRTLFNYIESDIETINAPLSNLEKDRLKQRLQSIRFWNSDIINYNMENYERSLINE